MIIVHCINNFPTDYRTGYLSSGYKFLEGQSYTAKFFPESPSKYGGIVRPHYKVYTYNILSSYNDYEYFYTDKMDDIFSFSKYFKTLEERRNEKLENLGI